MTMDDATAAIYSAFLVEDESRASNFRALNEVFSQHGLPRSLYTDRGAHYFHTPKAGGDVDRGHLTQVGRRSSSSGSSISEPIRRRPGVVRSARSGRFRTESSTNSRSPT